MEAAAIAVPDDIRDEEVKVYVVLTEGETPESVPPEEIISWCSERLAKFKIHVISNIAIVYPKQRPRKYKKMF